MAIELVALARSRVVLRLSSDQIALLFGLVASATYRMMQIDDLEARLGVSESEIRELVSELSAIIDRMSKKPVDEVHKDIRHIGLYGTEDDHATIDVTFDQVVLFRDTADCTFARLEEWKDTHSLLGFWPDEVQAFIDALASLASRMSDAVDQG